MSDEVSPRRNLESLKKEAKRWLDALQANDRDARARLHRHTLAMPHSGRSRASASCAISRSR
jgi:hypothetical protein